MPKYKVRITAPAGGDVRDYTMTLTDVMDECLRLSDGEGNNIDSLANIAIYYRMAGTGTIHRLPGSPQSYHQYVTEGYGGDKTAFTSEDEESDDLESGYYIVKSENLYSITAITQRISEVTGDYESGFVVNFNMAALKDWAEANGMKAVPSLEIRYTCVVTDSIRVASELNTNRVEIEYEISDDGMQLFTQEDSVNLYTYGVAIHKQDGDTGAALAGAGFYLYKRIGEFSVAGTNLNQGDGGIDTAVEEGEAMSPVLPPRLEPEEGGETPGGTGEEGGSTSGDGTGGDGTGGDGTGDDGPGDEGSAGGGVMTFRLTDERYASVIPLEYTKADDYKNDPDYYVYSYQDEVTGTDVDAIFIRLDYVGDNGNIVTTVDGSGKNEEGDLVRGLKDGQYLLMEHTAPEGYNRLSDDMLFTIGRFTVEEATAYGQRSLAAFKDVYWCS